MRRFAFIVLAVGCAVGCGSGGGSKNGASAVNVAPVAAPPAPQVVGSATRDGSREPPLEIAASHGNLCARVEGRVYCAKEDDPEKPVVADENAIVGIDDAKSIALGQSFGCIATRAGTVRCFGDNTFGQLGAKSGVERSGTPLEVVGLRNVRRVVAGTWHACAVLDDGGVRCWGRNDSGQTGSDTVYQPEARELAGFAVVPGVKAEQIACSSVATCARSGGSITCWGQSQDEQRHLYGLANDRPTPLRDISGIDEIAGSESGFCALRRGEIVCWGDARRMIADAKLDAPSVIPGIKNAKRLRFSGNHGCALLEGGRVACFGHGHGGALGRPTDENRYYPLPGEVVEGLPRAVDIAVAAGRSCALTADGELYCWGQWYLPKGTRTEIKPIRVRFR